VYEGLEEIGVGSNDPLSSSSCEQHNPGSIETSSYALNSLYPPTLYLHSKLFYKAIFWARRETCRPTSHSTPASRHVLLLSLYKILFHFKALLWESIILLCPHPPAKPTLLQYYCASIAQYTSPHRPPLWYVIHYTILVMAVSCKGQAVAQGLRASISTLAFTRCSFTSNLLCTHQASLHSKCIAHTIARRLHDYCEIYDPPLDLCKGSQQGGSIKGNISAATLNRFLPLGSVLVGAH